MNIIEEFSHKEIKYLLGKKKLKKKIEKKNKKKYNFKKE
jgi:hypothetical protein